jgi:UPF0176 protein
MIVLTFYKFVTLEKVSKIKAPLLRLCKSNDIKGTILLGREGVNGTISGPERGIKAIQAYFEAHPKLANMDYKTSEHPEHPFYRMKIKIKKEIVTIGRQEVDPQDVVGTYVDGQEWNALLEDPEVVVIDTRNTYEYDVGTFKNAANPYTTNFCEFPDYVKSNLDPKKNKKVAMFCTGGIRCEKASSYMLQQGFEEVYHLKGGILKYLQDVPEEESLWQGECFVFDNRVTVNHRLEKGSYELCHACRHPVSAADMQSPQYVQNISCPHCFDSQSERNRERAAERAKQIALAKKRGEQHIGG